MPFTAAAVRAEAATFSILEDVEIGIVDLMRHDAAFAPAAVIGNATYRVHRCRSLGDCRGNSGFGRSGAEIADAGAFGAIDFAVQKLAVTQTPVRAEMVERCRVVRLPGTVFTAVTAA